MQQRVTNQIATFRSSDAAPASRTAQANFTAAVRGLLGGRPVRIVFWDGARMGDADSDGVVIRLRSRRALDRLLGAAPERGFGRAYVEGLIDIEPLEAFLTAFATTPRRQFLSALPGLAVSAWSLGSRPSLAPVAGVEARLHGRRHSIARDAAAIRHHYDLPEAFYALWLGRTLTYSCAYFANANDSLDVAQEAKLDLVCRKLRLRPGERVLDVGCGWGSFPIFASERYGAHVVGITLSERQVATARRRVRERGLESQVEIRLADYREALGEPFDAIASLGMVEHVGRRRMDGFARAVYRSVRPGGRVLIHGITRAPGRSVTNRGSFVDSFVFPDGELEPITWRDGRLEAAGLELRDVENLREHYVLTLRQWVNQLNAHWDEAVEIVGEGRARVWRLYMTGSLVAFRLRSIAVYQSLFVRPERDGSSFLPLQRADWYGAGARQGASHARFPEVEK